MRLIDADYILNNLNTEFGFYDTYEIPEILEQCPTVDAEPVKHGKWIPIEDFNGDFFYECSCCGGDFTCIEGTPEKNDMLYCPFCGAKMDLKDSEQEEKKENI